MRDPVQPSSGANPGADGDPWLTKVQAAEYTQKSKRTIERAVKAGSLRQGGTPRGARYRRSWLDEWMHFAGTLLALLIVVWALAVLAGCVYGLDSVCHTLTTLHLQVRDRL